MAVEDGRLTRTSAVPGSLLAYLERAEPVDEEWPEIADPLPEPIDLFEPLLSNEMMKRISWSAHAREALVERGIHEDWITRTLVDPERLEPDELRPPRLRAFRRIPEFGDRWLRVVYVEQPDEYRIVTVFFDRQAGRQRETIL
jgi:hypothetical protein